MIGFVCAPYYGEKEETERPAIGLIELGPAMHVLHAFKVNAARLNVGHNGLPFDLTAKVDS